MAPLAKIDNTSSSTNFASALFVRTVNDDSDGGRIGGGVVKGIWYPEIVSRIKSVVNNYVFQMSMYIRNRPPTTGAGAVSV